MKFKTRIPQLQKSEIDNKCTEKGNNSMQFVSGITASLSICAVSANISWTSPALPYLKSNQSTFPVTDEQESWIISIYNISDIIGALLVVLLLDRIGRKCTLLVSGLPSFLSWLFIIFADNYVYLLIAKFIGGVAQGCTYATIVIYLSEISEKNVRGALISIMRILSVTSSFIFTAIGTFLPYQTLTLSCTVMPILFVATFIFMPESPYYFLMKNRDEEAVRSMMRLRSVSNRQILIPIIKEMKLDVENYKSLKKNAPKELFLKRHNQKGLLIVACMKVTQLMTGHSAIISYTEEIFTISGSSFKPKESVLILAGVRVIGSFIVGGLMEHVSKRMNFFVSGILASVFLATMGLFFFVKLHLEADVSSIKWLPLVALTSFEFVYYMGLNVVPYAIQGEIFPLNVRSIAVSGGMMFGSVCSFVTTSGYYEISKAAGVYSAFWFFALVAACGSIISFLVIPATNGKTLEEIQAMRNPEFDLQRSVKA